MEKQVSLTWSEDVKKWHINIQSGMIEEGVFVVIGERGAYFKSHEEAMLKLKQALKA